jgi:uncharacterized protein YqhQ
VSDKRTLYGGQAVIEGVMMRGPTRWALAVRRADGSIWLHSEPYRSLGQVRGWARWPVVRGNVALYEALALGWKGLQLSAQMALADSLPAESSAPALSRALATLTGVTAVVLGVGAFVVLPTWGVDWLRGGRQLSGLANNALEALLRLLIIGVYLLVVGLLPDIRRVFQYHGAEHAAINAYEAGQPLIPEQVAQGSVLHMRCGTSFLLTVIVVKLVVNCFLGWPPLWLRMLLRLAVLPLVAGLAYEAIYYAGRHPSSPWVRLLAAPSLLLQKLTTRRPTRAEVEVGLHALAAVAGEDVLPPGLQPAQLWEPADRSQAARCADEPAASALQPPGPL